MGLIGESPVVGRLGISELVGNALVLEDEQRQELTEGLRTLVVAEGGERMYDKDKIIPGLTIFVLLVTFPIWYNHGDVSGMPTPELPKDKKECVRPVAEMRAMHMQLLNQWRDEVIREGRREFDIEADGHKYQRSLQNTCMQCHVSKARFCDDCHSYASAQSVLLGLSPCPGGTRKEPAQKMEKEVH